MHILNIYKSLLNESRLNVNLESTAFMKIDFFHVLYDFVNDEIIGAMNLTNYGDFFDVGKSAALKGYGPLLYDLAMMDVYPKPLTPDRDGNLSGEAYNIWEYYSSKRKSDVKKVDIPKTHPYYNEDEADKEVGPSNPLKINTFNVFYYQKPNEIFKVLTDNSKKVNVNEKEFSNRVDEFIESML